MTEHRYVHCGYLDRAIDPPRLRETIEAAAMGLTNMGVNFDSIAFRGMSGALVAPALALKLDKGLIMVRKKGEDGHSSLLVEGAVTARRYVIVDDFVCTGNTVRNIYEAVKDFAPEATCAGVWEYNSRQFHTLAEYGGRVLRITDQAVAATEPPRTPTVDDGYVYMANQYSIAPTVVAGGRAYYSAVEVEWSRICGEW